MEILWYGQLLSRRDRVRESLRQKKVSLFTLFMTVTETGT